MLAVPPRFLSDPLSGEAPVSYIYDGQGREVSIERGSNDPSVITIAYDALGRRASETQQSGSSPGRTVSWQYDIASRPTRLTWPDNFYVTYDHSPAVQLTAIRDSAGAALISYGYDVFGRMASLTRANGLVTSYTFDPVARLSRLNHQGLLYTDLTYNPASQIVTRTLSNSAWAWDEAMNVNLSYDVNNLNQYTEVGTTLAYDATGNLTDDGPNGYVYDAENRMRWSVRASPSQTVHLRYDGRGRLRRRWGSGAGTTDYVYDGDAMIVEYNADSGAVLRRYIHGAGVDDPLIWDEGAGTSNRRFLHADERGSITTVTNATGGIIARNTYDDWGVPGAANIGRFQYTGQQWLPEIGLYYYKARFYAPAIGRFMQTDPIGYEDGMNLYAYVGNNPMSGRDPSGRASVCATETGSHAKSCVTVDADGDGSVSDNDLSRRDTSRLSSAFHHFIVGNAGADLSSSGAQVYGVGASASQVNYVRAVSQFAGHNIGGWRNSEIAVDPRLSSSDAGSTEEVVSYRPESTTRYIHSINPNFMDHRTNPSSLVRTLFHEFGHREEMGGMVTSPYDPMHQAIDRWARQRLRSSGLGGGGCPAIGGMLWGVISPTYPGC